MKHRPKTTAKSKTRIKVKARSKGTLDAGIKSKARTTASPSAKPETIDEYFALLSDDQRGALQELRKSIQAAAPAAVECISYQLPAFRLNGKLLVAFGAWANHCAFYPGAVMEDLGVELKGYDTSKGTIRFLTNRPLPAALVRKLVKARIAKNMFQQRHAHRRI
mgnify:CR=1 FL=1